ncbi:hypothetical protein LWF15_26400 [Kineosporia rhizophila]|uniref:hypothetical protein n=1 Tax=Kineosporia rhizophila TaxID=84633 RepID=UPI001E5E0052|nr:hypothetical protein [Kineosporia rhizophila]MCE0539036.1 hypothetical protein [Kineosporia rhizophila]
MSAVVEAPGPVQYVAAVREALSDLEPEEIEELTGGLEADLADALAESTALPDELFGRPEVYAAELRAAAGLPARVDEPKPSPRRFSLLAEIDRRKQAFVTWLDAQPIGPDVRAFGVTCLPLWWALRGYVVYQLIQVVSGVESWAPEGIAGWLLCLVLMIASIEVGRRNLALRNRISIRLTRAANLATGIALFLGVASLLSWAQPVDSESETMAGYVEVSSNEGVLNNGELVRNIFPYDAEGNLLKDVQLFDDQGRPLVPSEKLWYEEEFNNQIQVAPAQTADEQLRYNVYPLKETLNAEDDGFGNPVLRNLRDATAPSRMQYPVTPPTVPNTLPDTEPIPGDEAP